MQVEWDLCLAKNAKEALDLQEASPFDIVIADMHMPGMGGMELLDKIAARYPNVIRMIMAGHADEACILKHIGKSHLFLEKSCEQDALIDSIKHACGIRDLLSQRELVALVSKMKSLPSLPSAYMELVQELRAEEPSIQKIAETISRDISMMAKIMHVANSAFFCGYSRVVDLKDAIMRLGLKQMEALVLYSHAFSQFDKRRAKSLGIEEVMAHSLFVGSLAKAVVMAEGSHQATADSSLIAGMMHDIGKVVLSANMPEQYAEVLRLTQFENMLDWEAEEKVFGTTHADVGAYLMGLWGLSYVVVEAIAFHHYPESAFHKSGILMAVHVANALEHQTNTRNGKGPVAEVDFEYLIQINLADHFPMWEGIYQDMREKALSQV